MDMSTIPTLDPHADITIPMGLLPPTTWAHNTVASELAAGIGPLPARVERRRAAMGTQASDAPCLRISGTVFTDAHIRQERGAPDPHKPRRAWLQVVIVTPGEMLWLAAEDLGTSPTAHAVAKRRTATLRRGTPCTIYAHGAAESMQAGQSVVVLSRPTVMLDGAQRAVEAMVNPSDRDPS